MFSFFCEVFVVPCPGIAVNKTPFRECKKSIKALKYCGEAGGASMLWCGSSRSLKTIQTLMLGGSDRLCVVHKSVGLLLVVVVVASLSVFVSEARRSAMAPRENRYARRACVCVGVAVFYSPRPLPGTHTRLLKSVCRGEIRPREDLSLATLFCATFAADCFASDRSGDGGVCSVWPDCSPSLRRVFKEGQY